MRFRALLVACLLMLLALGTRAQTETADPVIGSILETIAENGQPEEDYSELAERLHYIKEHPLDLNTVTAGDLCQLVFISPLQAENLIRYREENGPFTDLQELQLIDLYTWPLIEQLLPFVEIRKSGLLQPDLARVPGRLEWMSTFGKVLQHQKGYQADDSLRHYEGSSFRLVSRLRYYQGNKISAAVTMEKDAGERLAFQNGAKGFDFYSANVFIRGNRMIRKVALGDYSLQFGQGLALWSGLGFGKGATISGIAKTQAGLRPYSSTSESGFFRGLAATLVFQKLEISPFISYRKIDASVVDGDSLRAAEISSISVTGLHRTASELNKRNAEEQMVLGSVVQYEHKGFRLGALVSRTHLSKALQSGKALYERFDYSGSDLTTGSVYSNYTWKNTYSFAELAHSSGGGLAIIGGIMGSLSRQVSAVVLYRNYQADYHSFFNGAVAEGTGVANERGLYSGLNIRLNSRWEWSLYADLFRFPWMRYRVDAPSVGKEIVTQAVWSPSKQTKLSFRFRSVGKQQNDVVENAVNYLVPVQKENYRLDLIYSLNKTCTLRNRAELVRYQKDSVVQYGSVLYQDVIFKPLGGRFSGNLRVAWFHTGGFDSRIYAFENDVLYSYGMTSYQDRGMRFYLNGRYRVGRDMDIWLRYACSMYRDKKEIGSDMDLIAGNKKSDVRLQFRYIFR